MCVFGVRFWDGTEAAYNTEAAGGNRLLGKRRGSFEPINAPVTYVMVVTCLHGYRAVSGVFVVRRP